MKHLEHVTFTSAAEAGRLGASKELVKAIKSQPGYRAGMTMMLAKVKDRDAYRLFGMISRGWMDASLEDINL